MAGYGIPEAEIAGVVGVSPKTLKASGDGREAVITAIFRLKTRAGWKENSGAGTT